MSLIQLGVCDPDGRAAGLECKLFFWQSGVTAIVVVAHDTPRYLTIFSLRRCRIAPGLLFTQSFTQLLHRGEPYGITLNRNCISAAVWRRRLLRPPERTLVNIAGGGRSARLSGAPRPRPFFTPLLRRSAMTGAACCDALSIAITNL